MRPGQQSLFSKTTTPHTCKNIIWIQHPLGHIFTAASISWTLWNTWGISSPYLRQPLSIYTCICTYVHTCTCICIFVLSFVVTEKVILNTKARSGHPLCAFYLLFIEWSFTTAPRYEPNWAFGLLGTNTPGYSDYTKEKKVNIFWYIPSWQKIKFLLC